MVYYFTPILILSLTFFHLKITKVIIEDLGFGEAKLVLACPNSWLDVSYLSDLSDVAIQLRNKGMDLRIATKYPKLVRDFLKQAGVNYFILVSASGGFEAAPILGYADMIADITVTGTTIRHNDIKIIKDWNVSFIFPILIYNHIISMYNLILAFIT